MTTIFCENCEKEFQFETINERHIIAGDCSNTFNIECPFCKEIIVVKTFPD